MNKLDRSYRDQINSRRFSSTSTAGHELT